MDTDGHHLVTWKSGSLGWFRLGEPPIMPKHCKKYQIKGIFMNFRSICCVLQVQAYGDPAQYLECFNLAVLVIHNLAVQVGLKEGGWGSQILADRTQEPNFEFKNPSRVQGPMIFGITTSNAG